MLSSDSFHELCLFRALARSPVHEVPIDFWTILRYRNTLQFIFQLFSLFFKYTCSIPTLSSHVFDFVEQNPFLPPNKFRLPSPHIITGLSSKKGRTRLTSLQIPRPPSNMIESYHPTQNLISILIPQSTANKKKSPTPSSKNKLKTTHRNLSHGPLQMELLSWSKQRGRSFSRGPVIGPLDLQGPLSGATRGPVG